MLLALAFKGNRGEPIAYQSGHDTRVGGPFESSNSTARFALTEAIAEDGKLSLNLDRAKFASPDVVETSGKFYSVFTPGISFIAVPFYILGKYLGIPQLITYFSVALFSLVNVFLVAQVARKLGASFWASIFGGFVFLFATNALGYSQTLTQHNIGVSVLLLATLITLSKTSFFKNVLFGALAGIGLLIDVPILILTIPLGLYLLARHIKLSKINEKLRMSISLSLMGLLLGIIPFIMFFGWYNHQTTGSYTTLAQSLGRTDAFSVLTEKQKQEIAVQDKKVEKEVGLELPFDTRLQMQGFYILVLSPERAWLFYSPIVFLGIAGLFVGWKSAKRQAAVSLFSSVVLLNIVLYSMFGDPWGGWSFGPRYLIPAAALLCAFLPLFLDKYKKNYFVILTTMILFGFSVYINSIGVLTTNAIPPKVEAIALSVPIPYTPEYNLNILQSNQSSSLLYNLYLSAWLPARNYAFIYIMLVFVAGIGLYTISIFKQDKEKK